ncbi:hypothetical protein L1I30_13715 [Gillisia sp. M10.2A]|uniref:Uncharacterized protein n=1 Tax=Gillisia lutea TaxID=2909668 RepID=A0ABS9EIQ4_9FLAO|nr:hypothetical protein [Gillisia lutea]MCF4102730.1 hypothetical protein [Gillisia lutea]
MKKSFFAFAAIALVLSFTSCKENASETEEVEIMETETPAEVIETPVVEEVDSTSQDTLKVEENMNETAVN